MVVTEESRDFYFTFEELSWKFRNVLTGTKGEIRE